VCPELNVLILRMLSDAPEARGSAGEVAQALEQAAEHAGSRADAPIIRRPRGAASTRRVHPAFVPVALGLTAAVGGALVALCAVWLAYPSEQHHTLGQGDRGTVALGETASLAPEATTTRPDAAKGLGLDMPGRPFTGQLVPPCQGLEVEIELTPGRKDTRSCWIKVDATAEKCKTKGYEYRGGCYLPTYPSPKLPQSIGP
jgi:hypothetical protein